jgi:two-component system LytT family sensor kinase
MRDGVSFPRGESPNWRKVWTELLILWAVFALLGTWLNYGFQAARGRPISWTQAIRINVSAYAIWAFVLTPIVLFLCARIPLDRKVMVRFVPGHLLGMCGTVSLDILLKTLLHKNVYVDLPHLSFGIQLRQYFFSQTEADVQIYLVVVVLGYVVAYYTEVRGQELHASQLETNLVRAELQVLKMQLQPHFLFNTLHSISSLVPTNPRAAQQMICSLGDLLRLSLVREDLPETTLRRELDFLNLYLDIEKARFRDRLVTTIDVAGEVLDARVPYLLLQPLVENAIKHGVSRRPGSGRVEISAFKDSGQLCIRVTNDKGEPYAVAGGDRMGIGLDNTRSRLRILYGSNARLSIQRPGERFQVEVCMPFRQEVLLDEERGSLSFA